MMLGDLISRLDLLQVRAAQRHGGGCVPAVSVQCRESNVEDPVVLQLWTYPGRVSDRAHYLRLRDLAAARRADGLHQTAGVLGFR
jgi:hypothetical protein